MTTIAVTGIQRPAGRKTEYIRVFGIREGDQNEKLVEVAISPREASDLMKLFATAEPVVIEVEDRHWTHCGSLRSVEIVPMRRNA